MSFRVVQPRSRPKDRTSIARSWRNAGRWPWLAPLYHAAALKARPLGYVVLPVVIEGLLFVGCGSAILWMLLPTDRMGTWAPLLCVASLQFDWHLLHCLTRWGGRLRLTPHPLRRAFQGERLLVSALVCLPVAGAAAMGQDPGSLVAIASTAIFVGHLQCEVRWLMRYSDLWTIQWEDEDSRTAFGPRHTGKQRRFWEQFHEILELEKSNARVVDIGSGNLDISEIAHSKSADFELHATDTSHVDVSRFDWAKDLEFHRWPFEETEFPNGYLDAITSSNAIEYSVALDDAIAEVFRGLREGGRAALLIHHPDSSVVAHFRRSADNIALLRSLEIDDVIERYLRRRKPEDRKALQNKLAEMKRTRNPELIKQAKLIEKFHEDPHAAYPWIEFKDTVKRNEILANTLIGIVETVTADGDELRARFEKVGFEIERFERFPTEHEVVNWAVLVRKPLKQNTRGLGESFPGFENSLTTSLRRSVALGMVRELLQEPKKAIRESGDPREKTLKADRAVAFLKEQLDEATLGVIRVQEIRRTHNGVVFGVTDSGDLRLVDLAGQTDAWVGGPPQAT
ncbi:methyltransferase domain-containing protein [Myxococcota bacterium]|nr:methyltransferase domain-containing protein [Myxococcota bacterium]